MKHIIMCSSYTGQIPELGLNWRKQSSGIWHRVYVVLTYLPSSFGCSQKNPLVTIHMQYIQATYAYITVFSILLNFLLIFSLSNTVEWPGFELFVSQLLSLSLCPFSPVSLLVYLQVTAPCKKPRCNLFYLIYFLLKLPTYRNISERLM
jgi:hypothetical protein